MAENCRVCSHPEIRLINELIGRGTGLATLAARFDLGEDSLSRHRTTHVDSVEIKSVGLDPQELLLTLLTAKAELERIAYDPGSDPRSRMEALKEIRQNSEAIAKLTGANKSVDPKHLIPFWNKIRTRILGALNAFPEARESVLKALEDEIGGE